ncbi:MULTISPECIES: CinA family protein [unclassified Brevundimonas]|jgi:nicotinamide-nucleotide amidase|uniref:CinA family protein n=1 Tax=unclassified Brevundimonas TaxID=2622653 RepID=UPI000C4D515A|nr:MULTISPECIES: nicotinamide-nucleotide amidohydrolase family protein [unclassified Brevundimonas]MAL87563.1 damage-inducible protein CinA [Brevundimonas sp.]|tara:strand:- start:53330 stop:53818 length:489 start_codon:yes stop_codon:yes gene_type:complete
MFTPDLMTLAEAVVARAQARGMTLATAESCTGGLVAALITSVAGSSAVLEQGAVTYSNAAKTRMLDVPAALIEAHGAVSQPVAEAMATGARARAGVGLAVSITGVAGPGGGSAEKPVGLVHFGLATADGVRHLERRFGEGDRQAIRLAATEQALRLLLDGLA